MDRFALEIIQNILKIYSLIFFFLLTMDFKNSAGPPEGCAVSIATASIKSLQWKMILFKQDVCWSTDNNQQRSVVSLAHHQIRYVD